MTATTEYRFPPDSELAATSGYAQAQKVIRRETGEMLGWVRRITEPVDRGSKWAVYDATGAEVGIADLRSTAANYLWRHHGEQATR